MCDYEGKRTDACIDCENGLGGLECPMNETFPEPPTVQEQVNAAFKRGTMYGINKAVDEIEKYIVQDRIYIEDHGTMIYSLKLQQVIDRLRKECGE